MRLEAVAWFERHEKTSVIAAEFRVSERSVETWRRAWREAGPEALMSEGAMNEEKLTPQQWDRLVLELQRGPLAHGFEDDQRWTLKRIKLLIGRARASSVVARMVG